MFDNNSNIGIVIRRFLKSGWEGLIALGYSHYVGEAHYLVSNSANNDSNNKVDIQELSNRLGDSVIEFKRHRV